MQQLATILCAATVLSLTACQKAEVALPDDPLARAATCYAARLTEYGGGESDILKPEQANEAIQYVYLGAVNDGIAEQSKLAPITTQAEAMRFKLEQDGNAKDFRPACEKAYPSTKAGSFKQLPPDDRGTRMMCYTLTTAALQTYQSSGIAPPPATMQINSKLDEQLRGEINAEGDPNVGELAGFAMRNMAKAVEAGPMNDVLKACLKRYGSS